MRRNVYFHEFNIPMGDRIYLPNVSGMLRAYAETIPAVKEKYCFEPFLFVRQGPQKIAEAWDRPSVMAFSSSMWNHQLNLELARLARERFPDTLIVFGGPHVPTRTEALLEQYPFVDVAVRGEGEVTFGKLLEAFIQGRDFSEVTGLVFRHPTTGELVRTPDRELVDINRLPSPYLEGYYDQFIDDPNGVEFQVIVETNRGCPFHCSFCSWGNGIIKVRTFNLERLRGEIEWVARKGIKYVFGADANFGMLPRDHQIAELFAEVKQRTGFPNSFRVCFGKNATDRVYNVAKLLDRHELTKGVTLSFQSTDPHTLATIGRSNIKLETYRELLRRYRQDNMRVYTELILGLPGETYHSFKSGIEEVFQAGLYDQVGIFLCEVLPNTEMDDPAYNAKHGIQTRRIELAETHAVRRASDEVTEFEDIVVGTSAMPTADWKKAATLAWMAQTMHGLKLGFFAALYLFQRHGIRYTELFEYLIACGADKGRYPVLAGEICRFGEYLDGLLSGKPQCVFMDEFGQISWQIEEATFLRLSDKLPQFYAELASIIGDFLREQGKVVDQGELSAVVSYQYARMATLDPAKPVMWEFERSVPEYFDNLLHDLPARIELRQQALRIQRTDYHGDKQEFARRVIWFGRRDCRAIEPVTWS